MKSKFEMCVDVVVRAGGRLRERRAGRQAAGAEAVRGRGPRHLHADAGRLRAQGRYEHREPWRADDHLGQGGLHFLGAELQQRRLPRFRLRPARCRPSATSSAPPPSTTPSRSTPGSRWRTSPPAPPTCSTPRRRRPTSPTPSSRPRSTPTCRPMPSTPARSTRSSSRAPRTPRAATSTSCGGPSLAYCAYHGYFCSGASDRQVLHRALSELQRLPGRGLDGRAEPGALRLPRDPRGGDRPDRQRLVGPQRQRGRRQVRLVARAVHRHRRLRLPVRVVER